ncbi:MAG: hypothetical protein HC930_03125 [Hydrococcus sp. SU_1_0]|nr:hypothetical protein [Hydrococcus sp. SU_1_0]
MIFFLAIQTNKQKPESEILKLLTGLGMTLTTKSKDTLKVLSFEGTTADFFWLKHHLESDKFNEYFSVIDMGKLIY